jgi:PKD repeat protein/uncharacterized protein YjiK
LPLSWFYSEADLLYQEQEMSTQKRERSVLNIFSTKSNSKMVLRKLFKLVFGNHPHAYSRLSLGFALVLSFMWISASSARNNPGFIRQVQAMESDETGLSNPAGLAFSARTNAFQVVEAPGRGQPPPAETDLVQLTPLAHRAGSVRIAAQVGDPINMAFDNRANRLLVFQSPANILIEVSQDEDGNLDPATLVRHDARSFGLEEPQGMSVDPASGTLFILDAVGPRLVRVEPEADGSFGNAVITPVGLQASGLTDVGGLAFDPSTGHLHLVSAADQKLYELTQAGEVVASRDLSRFGLRDPQGMVFAPSGDQTDDPLQMSLYLADSGIRSGQGQALRGAQEGGMETPSAPQSSGQIVELSLTALAAPAASDFTSSLIQTTDMAALSPPSPDSSGLTYLPNSDTLLVSDGEVEETVSGITHFQGANLWELTLGGSIVRTANISNVAPIVVPMTNEPTGVAWNPADGHFFFTDDNAQEVYELNPGTDGLIGTADDTWSSFDTLAAGSGDPEGIAFDSWHNRLFVADGVNREIYEFTLSGSLVSHFDVQQYGVGDPESVEFNPASGTLFVLSSNSSSPVAVETDTSGNLLQTIDISAANAIAAAGLAYAPASDGSGAQRFYIVDRGIDNNTDENIIDGKMYELTAPAPPTSNTPPIVDAGPDQTSSLADGTILNGSVTDDGFPDPPGAVTVAWSQVSGPGTVSFSDANALSTTAGFSSVGNYVLNLTASDGELSAGDDVNVYVTQGSSAISFEVRVKADYDDAEESATGSMDLTSTDLELVYDRSDQTVGMRFNGIDIPPGATIANAYIQFQVDEANSGDTSLSIQGEASDHALIFSSSNFDITSRARTSAAVSWNPNPWVTVGEAGPDQQTPDIAAVIQEIVDRPGWVSGNSLAIIITGTGERTAEAHDGVSAAAPLLHVEYIPNAPVVAIASPANGGTFTEGSPVTFTGTANDIEDGDLTAGLSWISDLDGAIGTGGSFTLSSLSVGMHSITASALDSSGNSGSDRIDITVLPGADVLVGAGDIARCDSGNDEETAALLDDVAGTVFTLGDNAYPDGTAAEFNDCYDPSWGRHKARTRPAPGNHDYHTTGASGYFDYFGAAAGNPGEGYYSYDVGDWHIIVLNSECSEVGGCETTSPQGVWLEADLAANPSTCTLAYWHIPLFSSDSVQGTDPDVRDFWSMLYAAGADIVLNGHAHTYERFAPQNPNGVADPDHGIREFIVGTGGGGLYSVGTIQPNSEVREDNTHGVLKLSLNPGSYDWEFIPIAGQTFTDSGSASCVTAPSGNNASTATDDGYTADEDVTLSVATPGVLGNDSDPDGDPLTAVLVSDVSNGILSLAADGSFTYTPNPNFNGLDTFTYVANDGLADSNIATVNLTVNPVNDLPVANAGGPYAGTIGVPVQFDGSGSSDVDGTILSYDWDFGDGTSGSGATPVHAYAVAGTYTVVLTVTDNNGSTDSDTTSASIQSAPNQVPVAVDDAYQTDEDVQLTVAAPGVLGNDSDPDGDPLTAVLVSDVSNGTLSLAADGSFTYTPNLNFNGSDAFTYHANDGLADSNIATVNLTVNPVNDLPVADAKGPYAGTIDVPVQFDGSGSSDVDGTILSYDWDFGDGATGSGANPTHTYAAAGTYTVVLTVTDNNGSTDSDTTSARIQSAPNQVPVAVDDAYQTDEDVQLTVAAPGVLGNDSDPDGDPLTAVLVGDVSNGILSLAADGSFTYTPNPNFDGLDTFTYVASDGLADSNAATVAITVNTVAPPMLSFLPSGDASVYSNDPSANFGDLETLELRNHKKQMVYSFLKFDVSGLSGDVASVKLRLYSNVGSNSSVSIYSVSNNYRNTSISWIETGLSWNNAPTIGGTPLDTLDSIASGTWIEFDLTQVVSGDGVYSFSLLNTSPNWVIYNSKEAIDNQPVLIVTFQGIP